VNLKDIAEVFGSQWTVDHLLPKIVDQYSHNAGYANRVTTLQVLPQVSHVMTADQIVSLIVPLLIKATKDSVPNVRFCACRILAETIEKHNISSQGSTVSMIKAALTELDQDTDVDVKYYAQRALLACGNA